MNAFKKYVLYFLIPMVLVILWLGGFFEHKISPGEKPLKPKVISNVKVITVSSSTPIEEEFEGVVSAKNHAAISTRLMSKVLGVYVKDGDCVKRGQLLVKLDTKDISSMVAQANYGAKQAEDQMKAAEANLQAISKTYQRFQKLIKTGAVTEQEYDEVKAKYEAAKAMVEQAKNAIMAAKAGASAAGANLAYANIIAPFSGCIYMKNVNVGDIAAPGMPLMMIDKPPYRVDVALPEKYINKITPGQTLKVYIGGIDKTVEGTVKEVSKALNPMSHTFDVKIDIPNQDGITSGLYAKVYIPKSQETVVTIPKDALFKWDDIDAVWLVDKNNITHMQFVKLGQKVGDSYVVLSGLKPGDRIVEGNVYNVCDKCKIGE